MKKQIHYLDCYLRWHKGDMCVCFYLYRAHEILCRGHEIQCRGHEILCRGHENYVVAKRLLSRGNEIVCRVHE
jgi:hypothetical protein